MMEIKGLSHLGGKTEYKDNYAPEMLEAFENK
ncbi:MAG: NADPH-dependent 7-cyano-7-deazaguanine reductase QueF, partial [Fermentimonas sp.]